jgi:hypothetical protein
MKIHITPRIRNIGMVFLVSAGLAASLIGAATSAQTPGRRADSDPAPATPARASVAPTATQPEATLLQLMRGMLYPASNVVFAAQQDLGRFTPPVDPSASPNPITSVYGGWTAVENASLALAESSHLVLVAGRPCSNGKIAPVERAEWKKFTEAMRQAALKSYKAAQTKSTDAMLDAASDLSDSCLMCHQMFRTGGAGDKNRCLP